MTFFDALSLALQVSPGWWMRRAAWTLPMSVLVTPPWVQDCLSQPKPDFLVVPTLNGGAPFLMSIEDLLSDDWCVQSAQEILRAWKETKDAPPPVAVLAHGD